MMRIEWCLLLLTAGFAVCESGCRPKTDARTQDFLKDRPLASYQGELLDLAFAAASAIPADPHIKDRSASQEGVVTACLDLDQPQRALRYIEKIDNWRGGANYADLAFYCVQHGATARDVEPYLDRAVQAAAQAEDWRRDRINVKMARIHAYLGQTEQAGRLEKDVVPSETGKVAGVKARVSDANAFDERVEELDDLIATGQFDVTKNALEACAQLFDRFYTDPKRRSQVEEKIKASWGKLPTFIRMDLVMEMAGSALDHTDPNEALRLVNETQSLMEGSRWPTEYRIPIAAKLSVLRFRAGDRGKARADADAMRALFETEGKQIVNIYRAGALRPLAEAYQAMGDTPAALDIYGRALEAGVENPNSRPRAEDLAATCCSMAVHAVDPGPQLWDRIHKIRQGLGDPW
jgi:tetratricopeptide (TPR) repeat protein